MNTLRALSAARVPAGRFPPRYFPVSAPCASGLHTICETPSRRDTGITSASIPRRSRLYCG
jgi:hypothetical protein